MAAERKEKVDRREVDRRHAVDPEKDRTWQDAAVFNRRLIARTHNGYRKFIKQVWFAIFILVVCVGIIFWQVFKLINDNRQRVNDIQNQRVAFCRDQNLRHDRTVARLRANQAAAETPRGLREFQQQLATIGVHVSTASALKFQKLSIGQSSQTVALIDTLVPKVPSCEKAISTPNYHEGER